MTPDRFSWLMRHGEACVASDAFDAAIAAFTAAISLNPTAELPYLAISHALSRKGDRPAAISFAENMHSRFPDSPAVACALAQALIDDKKFRAARAFMHKRSDKFDQSHFFLEIQGMLEFNSGNPFRGIELIRLAIARGLPAKPHVYSILIDILKLSGQFEAAYKIASDLPEERRAPLLRRLDEAEAIKRYGSEKYPDSHNDPRALRARIAELLEARAVLDASYFVQLFFRSDLDSADDFVFISETAFRLTQLGDFSCSELIGKALGAAMFHVTPNAAATYKYAIALMQAQSFADAGWYLLRLRRSLAEALPEIPEESLVRLLRMCQACGGISDAELSSVVPHATHAGEHPEPAFGTPASSGWKSPYVANSRFRRHVALCLFGQLRGFRTAWPITKSALAGHNVTVFVATWPRVGGGIGAQNNIDRKLPAAILEGVPSYLRARSHVLQRYENLSRLIMEDRECSLEELQAFFGTKHVFVDDEAAFNERHGGRPGLTVHGSLNQPKMFHMMSKNLRMMSEFEIENGSIFDVVIRHRVDRSIVEIADFDLQRAARDNVYLTDHFYHWAAGDQTSISSSAVADVVSGISPAVDRAGSFSCFPGASGESAEWLMGEWLVHHAVPIRALSTTRLSGLTSNMPDPIALLRCLITDLDARPMLDPTDITWLNAAANASREGASISTKAEVDEILRRSSVMARYPEMSRPLSPSP